ncbi:MAG: NADPH-dependent FMN reductase [Chitinophagales bacterium]
MTERKKIIAISGSTRRNSSNLRLIHAIEELTKEKLEITIVETLTELPHFNPDLDTEYPPQAVSNFRSQLKNSDGVLICTPEYAMGVPGTLKNALDWTVSSGEFSGKPVALITASTSGRKAHESLLGTLETIEAKIDEETQYLVSFIQVKLNAENKITDEQTMIDIQKLVRAFEEQMETR